MASLTGFAITIVLLLAGDTAGREIRPSNHGLIFQTSPPANSSPGMRSFFKGSSSSSSSSSSSDASPRNITESLPPAWLSASHGGGRRVGRALVIASLVCGITGGILLVASGLLYLFKKRRRKPSLNESFRDDDDDDGNNNNVHNANKVELAVPNPSLRLAEFDSDHHH